MGLVVTDAVKLSSISSFDMCMIVSSSSSDFSQFAVFDCNLCSDSITTLPIVVVDSSDVF